MHGKKIKLDFTIQDVMQRQRKTICIKGQEIPTWQHVWQQFLSVETKIKRLSITIAVLGLSLIVLAIVVIAGKL